MFAFFTHSIVAHKNVIKKTKIKHYYGLAFTYKWSPCTTIFDRKHQWLVCRSFPCLSLVLFLWTRFLLEMALEQCRSFSPAVSCKTFCVSPFGLYRAFQNMKLYWCIDRQAFCTASLVGSCALASLHIALPKKFVWEINVYALVGKVQSYNLALIWQKTNSTVLTGSSCCHPGSAVHSVMV